MRNFGAYWMGRVQIMAMVIAMFIYYATTFKIPYDYVPTVEEYISPHEYEPQLMHITWYLPTGHKTADGTKTHIGICASNRENLGKTAILYRKDTKEYITTLEIRDVGGAEWLKNGTCIDIYVESEEEMYRQAKDFGTEVYVQIVDADG